MRSYRHAVPCLVALVVCGVLVADIGSSPVSTAPSSGVGTLPASQAAPMELRAGAVRQLLAGHFERGLALLDDPALRDDPLAARVKTITADFLKSRQKAAQERADDLAGAVARVRLARLAEKHRPALLEAKLADELYRKVETVVKAMSAADEILSPESASQPAEMLTQARKSLEKAQVELASAEKLVGDGQGEWGKAFQAAGASLTQAMQANASAWEKARLPQDWGALKRAFEKVQDAMIDLGVLVAHEPLTVALSHARDAQELSDDAEKFLQQDWVKALIQASEARGKELLAQEKWSEALGIYGSRGGLSDLDENSLAYKEIVRRIHQHVRVLNLYGRNAADPGAEPTPATLRLEPPTQPAGAASAPAGDQDSPAGDAAADEPKWHEMIVGIDTAMVRKAIDEIDDNYVDRPDYRKIGTGALNAIKILAETRQAAGAFPLLKNDDKRKAFIKAVDGQLAQFKAEPTVDHLHVKLALDRVLDFNAKTVLLPEEVINMEYAEGMLGELDDFSGMIWPYEEEDFNKRTMGTFPGIGVQIRKDKGKPIEVVTPLPDSPALKAGILAGDFILKVDGKSTDDMEIEKAVKQITGPQHTLVKLTLRRVGQRLPLEVSVERDQIHIQTVKGWRSTRDGKWDYFLDPKSRIAYIRVLQFTNDTTDEIAQALKSARAGGADGVILDLRFNPGGLLPSAIEMADEFLARGLIVRTKGRNVPEQSKDADALGEFQDGKLVVLLNKLSASAAEIVSGALKDWNRAVIVGERSYGKGSVQRLIPVKNKKAKLKLTTAYYYLPSGRCLHRVNGAKDWGVDPDVQVLETRRQMNRWFEIRQENDLVKSVDAARLTALLEQELAEDVQLQTALLIMKLQLLVPSA